jgi:hypothetical protein
MAAPALSPLPANWATGAFRPRKLTIDAAHPTQFEIVVARLKLADVPHLWPYSPQLKAWAKAHKNQKYIPEHLLAAWDFHVVLGD